MEKKLRMIEELPEGRLRNTRIQLSGEDPEVRWCACCICAPGVLGAGDETAKQSGSRIAENLMVIVGAPAASP